MALPGDVDEQSPRGHAFRASPVDDFAHLDKSTREWLEKQTPESLALITELALAYDRSKFLGRFFRRIILAIVGGLGTAVLFGEQLGRVWTWVTGR